MLRVDACDTESLRELRRLHSGCYLLEPPRCRLVDVVLAVVSPGRRQGTPRGVAIPDQSAVASLLEEGAKLPAATPLDLLENRSPGFHHSSATGGFIARAPELELYWPSISDCRRALMLRALRICPDLWDRRYNRFQIVRQVLRSLPWLSSLSTSSTLSWSPWT